MHTHLLCTLSHSNELLAFKINICFLRFIFPFLIHFFLSVRARSVCVCCLCCCCIFLLLLPLFFSLLQFGLSLSSATSLQCAITMLAYGSGISCLSVRSLRQYIQTLHTRCHPFHSTLIPYIRTEPRIGVCERATHSVLRITTQQQQQQRPCIKFDRIACCFKYFTHTSARPMWTRDGIHEYNSCLSLWSFHILLMGVPKEHKRSSKTLFLPSLSLSLLICVESNAGFVVIFRFWFVIIKHSVQLIVVNVYSLFLIVLH